MASGTNSYLGFGKQSAKGTPQSTLAYMMFVNSSFGVNNVQIPLDAEAGGLSPLVRSVVRTGVTSAGAVEFIPRPETIGSLLTGAMGLDTCAAIPTKTGAYAHTITFGTDSFVTPYYTFKSAPGNLWGEQLQDCRIAALAFNWRAANFLRAQMSVIGGLPTPGDPLSPLPTPDNGPQFLTVLSKIEVPDGTALKVLSGSFVIGNAIPLDEQWIVGSYSPDDFDIVTRAIAFNFIVKLSNLNLYKQMTYDPSLGAAWTANLFKEGSIDISFVSNTMIASTDVPYSISFSANASNDNIMWTADPVGVRAGRQVLMSVTGTVLHDATPLTITVNNAHTPAY